MKAVIPLGPRRPNTLPHVLRALETHTSVSEVITVGEPPTQVTPDLHIDSPNTYRLSHWNVLHHLVAALEQIEDEAFVWIADDIFPLQPWTPGVYVRKDTIAAHLRRYSNKGNYTRAIRTSIEIIRRRGHDPETVPCGSIHRPWLVETDRVRETVKLILERGDGEWKAVYVAGLSDTIPAGDPKIFGHGTIAPGADMVSVISASWRRNAGRVVRETFPEPSRWER